MNFNEILNTIAKNNNTTPEQVQQEMQEAISAAFSSDNPETKEKWDSMPFNGSCPTPEQLTEYIVKILSGTQES